MKRKLLFIAMAICAMTAYGQVTVWNVGNDATRFPVSPGIGAGPGKSVYVDGLGIHTGLATNVNMGQVEANAKNFTSPTTSTDYTFINRFKFNGGGYSGSSDADAEPTEMKPTQRYLTINVSGNSTLYFIGVTGSSGSSRKMFVTDGTNLVGKVDFPAGSTLNEGTVQYTGGATTLYIYCNAAINLYYISATNVVVSSTQSINANKTIISERYFDILGCEMPDSSQGGLVIRKVTYDDGTSASFKTYIRRNR
ncbi:MAG: hypothetical protein BWY08_01346 [Bacteroidetes bacterium ADurb.Bin174]|nr:MAG: hypothetical protein BWY08_01346 [Bacteroidetes bacterium ADurb.Bin174]